jgi:putative tributyrin esterase
MALVDCDFYSDALEMSTSMTVVLPQRTRTQIGLAGADPGTEAPPVLYLLHGLSDDHTTWVRRTSLERYAAPLGLAVVMPAVQRSFYADEVQGGAYWTFLSQELPEVVASFFRVSRQRERTFVAGLSMGGYGALKWALRDPTRFAAAASMSGALDVAALAKLPDRPVLFGRIFGGLPGPADDVFSLLRATPSIEDLPALRVSCGTEDPLIGASRAFVRAAEGVGLDLTVDFGPGGHEWGYWDRQIQEVLAWLPGLRPAPSQPARDLTAQRHAPGGS